MILGANKGSLHLPGLRIAKRYRPQMETRRKGIATWMPFVAEASFPRIVSHCLVPVGKLMPISGKRSSQLASEEA
jgi:hypothetical protein